MKLKNLVNREVEVTVNLGELFEDSDVENCGEDYEVSEEQILDRINYLISNNYFELRDWSSYKFI